jgi:hypothetical protein
MATPNLTEIVTTTLRNRSGKLADNVTNNNALLRTLKDKGAVKKHSGGRTIVRELDYAENGTYKEYSGYEALDISASEVLSAAEYDWKQAAVAVTISGLEKRQNSGKEQIINLIEGRIKNAERTMANQTSVGIYSDGTGSSGKQIDGLQSIVADSPATGTVGGIDAANFAFWRNVAYDATTDGGAAASASNILGYMNTVFNQLIRGTDAPDLIVADYNYYGFYENSLQVNQRFTNDGKAGAGFTNLVYKGNVPVILDGGSGIPTNHMYFLNTDYLFWDVHQDAYMTPLEGMRPVNQDAEVFPIILQSNLTCSNRSLQGVLKD